MKHIISILFIAALLVACGGSKEIAAPEVDFRATAPAPGPAPTIKLEKPTTFQLDNGLTVIVVENNKLPTVTTSLYFDYPSLFEGEKAGLTSFFGPVMKAGTQNYTKAELDEELDFHAINLFNGSRSIGFSSLKKQLPKAVELMTEVLFQPTFSNQDELDKLVKQSVTGLEADSKNPDAIMSRVSNALLYGKDHPWGEYATAETFQNVSLADLKEHYDTYFKPNIGYLTIVGDITVEEAKAIAEENFSDWAPGEIPSFDYPEPMNVSTTEIAIIDLPTATQSNLYVTNLQDLSKANDDYFASVLGNHMLGGSSFAKLFLNLREDKGYTYGSYSQMGNDDKWKSRFNAYGKFRNEVTDSSLMEIMYELNNITTTPLTQEELQIAISERTGRFALGLENPQTIANYARTILLEGLNNDFYANYLKSLNEQTPDDVLAAMQNYVKPGQSRVIIVGKAEEIAPDLKAMGYPIKFYDIWANEIEDPTIKVDVGDATAEDVISNYFAAIGGKEKWENVNTIKMNYDVEITGVPMDLKGEMKVMQPNKSFLDLYTPAMGSVQQIVFDGKQGYYNEMGQKRPMDETEVENMQSINTVLTELDIDVANLSLDNIVDLDGEKAYKLILTKENGDTEERYYSVETGLFLKDMKVVEAQGQEVVVSTILRDYKEVNGYLYPSLMIIENGPMTIKMTLTDISFNEGVSESDFQ